MSYNPIANGVAKDFAFFDGIYEMYPSVQTTGTGFVAGCPEVFESSRAQAKFFL
jgi:hypothetical protein